MPLNVSILGSFAPVLAFVFCNGLVGYLLFDEWRGWIDANLFTSVSHTEHRESHCIELSMGKWLRALARDRPDCTASAGECLPCGGTGEAWGGNGDPPISNWAFTDRKNATPGRYFSLHLQPRSAPLRRARPRHLGDVGGICNKSAQSRSQRGNG